LSNDRIRYVKYAICVCARARANTITQYLLPKEEDELPNAGVDDAPKDDIELPKAGDDEAPKDGVLEGAPNTPVDVPNSELPVCEPNVFELPNGFGAKGLVL